MAGYPFVNFTAGLRKPALIPFHYFSPGDSVAWIQSIPGDVTSVNGLTGDIFVTAGAGVTVNTASPNIQVSSSANLTLGTLTGTVDGSNRVFTVPAFVTTCLVFKNGILQLPTVMYTISGTTVTFLLSFTPQVGDLLQCATS